jgi:hypothetical protein
MSSQAQIKVWDPLVRTFHWSLVGAVTIAFVTEDARDISNAVRSIQDIVNRELKRARVAGIASRGQSFNAGQELPELVNVIEKIYANECATNEVHLTAKGQVWKEL